MIVTYDNKNRLLILQMTEEIDHCMTEKIKNRADFAIEKYMPKRVIMDFKKVSFMDSAGIGMILGRYKTVKMLGGTLDIINVTPSIKKVLEMSGILKIVNIVES